MVKPSALARLVSGHPRFDMPAGQRADGVVYRSPKIADLVASLMTDGLLTPREIGLARRDGRADWQSLKRVWHCVAKFGNPTAE